MEQTWSTRLALRLWPALIHAPERDRRQGLLAVWQVVVYGPLALLGLVWLAAATSLPTLRAQWLTFVLLFFLVNLLARADFRGLLGVDDLDIGRGVHGRVVTWSAALLFGPTAIWVDWLLGLAAFFETEQGRMRRQSWWLYLGPLLLRLSRNTLPALAALALAARWGASLPLAELTGQAGWLALTATLLRIGLTLLLMVPPWLLWQALGASSPLTRIQQTVRYLLALLVYFVFADPFALFAAVIYEQSNVWVYSLFLAGLLLAVLLASTVARLAVSYRLQARRQGRLGLQAREMLAAPIDQLNLPEILSSHVPQLLPEAWVEIRVLPDTVLYVQAADWEPLADELWQGLLTGRQAYLVVPPVATARSQGFSESGLLVPITAVADDYVLGGIYVLFADPAQGLRNLPVLEALAAQIAAVLHKQDSFDEALVAQAEAFEREVYEQALQTEVYAQVLEYEKLSRELVAAGQIQASFLPRSLPEIAGWQLAVTLEPARQTSGDYYDVIDLGNGRWGLLVADVADKGLGPALFMALSRTMIRIYASEFGGEPAAALAAANHRILSDTDSDLFVTVFYAVVDTISGEVTYCNAGHNPGLHYQPGNGSQPHVLTRTALPLGVVDDRPWEQASLQMGPGDVLVLYSDGITDAQNEAEEFFGQEMLESVVGKNLSRPADLIESRLIDAVYDFVGDAPQFDDMTLLVLVRES